MPLEQANLDQMLLILIFGIIGIVVLLVALVAYISFSSAKGKREAPPARASPAEEELELPKTEAKNGVLEMLRLLWSGKDIGLIVEVGGKRYARLTDIKDRQIRQQVLQATAELMKFAGVSAGTAPAAPEAQPSSQMPGPQALRPAQARSGGGMLRFIEDGLPQRQIPATEKQPPSRLTSSSKRAEEEIKLPPQPSSTKLPGKPSIGGFFSQALKPPPEVGETSRSFIDEIEGILQELIARAPEPLGRTIHVRAGPTGALQIEVDGKFFDHADEIPDPVARELIKLAVKRWEKGR